MDPLAFDEEPSQEKGLEEVEHALSALAGRHPEHVRLEREDQARADRRRRELARAVVVEKKKRRIRLAKRVLAITAIGAAAYLVRAHVLEIRAARSLVDAQARTYASVGFAAFPDDPWTPLRAQGDVGPGSCVVAVAGDAQGAADLEIDRDGVTTKGHGSIGFCSCASEKITATTGAGAVRILRRSANDFGGPLGFTLRAVKPDVLVDSPCAEAQLDDFFKLQSSDVAAPDALEGAAATFAQIGYRPMAAEVSGAPFAIVKAPEQTCSIALSSEPISLRLTGGARPIQNTEGAIGFCTKKGGTFSVWRTGATPIQIASADATKSGGIYGMREVATRAGMKLSTWLVPEDLPWDAANALRASGISDVEELDPEAAGKVPNAATHFFSLSTIDGASVAPDTSQDMIFFSCAPPLGKAETVICAEAAPSRLRASTPRGSWGAASSMLPFWLAGYTQAHDPGAVPSEVALLTLARGLIHRGFEPTILGAIKEIESGVEVLGRAGEDSIVAVGAAPQAPWLVTYTDGPAWKIDGEPHVIPLAPGARITLGPSPGAAAFHGGVESRRTIVFRHAIAQEKK